MASRPPSVPSCQVLDMEELTIWEQHTATLCKVRPPFPHTGANRNVLLTPGCSTGGENLCPHGKQSSSYMLSSLRTPGEASVLQSLVAETGPMDLWLCLMWCPGDQRRADCSAYQGSRGDGREEGPVRAEARSRESAWRLPALPPQGLELAADRVGDVALPLPKALPGPPV